jgi:DegV family protein with EDD domain
MESTRTVAVVTDSTSDLPADIAARHGIMVIPLAVAIGDKTFLDGDLTQEEFFDLMGKAKDLPTTSQPSVGVFEDAYRRALETASSVVAIHISEKLSGTIESAREAAKAFGDQVQVFDSRNLSGGLGLQVIEAARAAADGAAAAEVLRIAESARDGVRLIVGVDKLDNLAKGGRIGAVSAFLGGLLSLKVTFTVDAEGKFEPVARTRGQSAALQHTVDWIKEKMGEHTRGRFCVLHALSEDKALWLKERIEEAFTAEEIHVFGVGPVISAHTGTGWGVAFLPVD